MSIAKQDMLTYIDHSWLLIPDVIYLILTRFQRREKPYISLFAER